MVIIKRNIIMRKSNNKMQDKNHYLKLLKKYQKLGSEDGIRATLEVLAKFDEKQISMERFVK